MRARASCSSAVLFLLLAHLAYFSKPYFWDEAGQFIPAALDIFDSGQLVPHSTIPNAHPPGVMLYLACVWRVFGYSIPATRLGMLSIALVGCWAVYRLVADFLCPDKRAAVMTLVLLCVSPLFFSQAIMAQLDMPSMVLTALALLFFLRERLLASSVACIALVLVKETGALVPALLGTWLVLEKRRRDSVWFLVPAFPLAGWLMLLYERTGHLFGSASFTQYNLYYPLHPVRLALAVFRRGYYLFAGTCYFIGTAALLRRQDRGWLRTRAWRLVAVFAAAQVLSVCVLGGAVLERYLLPVLPFTLAAFANALCALTPRWRNVAFAAMCAGSAACIVVNPIYPFPLENNLAWTDFVDVQRDAAQYLAGHMKRDDILVTSFPFGGCLRRPELGYTGQRLRIHEIPDFTPATVAGLHKHRVDQFAIFSSTWDALGVMRNATWIAFLERFYDYRRDVRPEELSSLLQLHRVVRFERKGQWIEIWSR